MSTGDAISVRGLAKTFGSGESATLALDGIDLTVRDGEFVVLLGPSGCGKTTLLRILGGLVAGTSGTVEVVGEGDIGFVFQEPNLMPWRDVRRNIELPLELRGVGKADRRRRSAELLDLIGLERFARAYPRQLSGGMRQRVAIARALACEPSVLLLDEPFAALDAQTREQLNVELLRIWAESAKTVVLVTHSISEAVFLADRVVMLSANPGRVMTVREVDFARPRDLSLLGDAGFAAMVSELRTALEEQ